MGLTSKLFKLGITSSVVFIAVLLGPTTLPEDVKFTEFSVEPVKYLGGGVKDNNLLDNVERLFEDEIKGPEAFEIVNGELYTTLHGGYVAKVFDDQIIPVVKFGEPCEGWWEEKKCGRPLGIKASGNVHLIVADSYYGIFSYNTKTKKFINLVKKDIVIDGKKAKIFNGVEVAKDGSIYWTHSSSDFNIEDGIFAFLADGSGRLMKYDPATQKNTVLLKDLYFPNGLVLSPDEDYLLISETGHSRVLKFYLQGPKKFTKDIFIDGLPGMPDNLRRNGNAGYMIPLVVTRDDTHPAAFQVVAPFPNVRKFAARFLSLIELSLGKIHEIYPNYFTKRALHYVGHLESVSMLLPLKATLLVVDPNGIIISSYHGNDGSVTSISDVIAHDGYLWLGSPVNNYLARVKLSKLDKIPMVQQSGQHTESKATIRHATTTTTTTTSTTSTTTPATPTTTPRPVSEKSVRSTTKPPPPSTPATTTNSPPQATIKFSTPMPPSKPSPTAKSPSAQGAAATQKPPPHSRGSEGKGANPSTKL